MSDLTKVQIDRIIRLPGADEQAAVGAVLADCEAELNLLTDRLRKASAIKQGMVQELLSGRTRLAVAEAVS
jgi:type I restriction enzyme S subunit